MRLLYIALIVFTFGCRKTPDPIEPETPTSEDRAEYDQAVGRLLTDHVYGGFGVVSLKPDGSAEHTGEALIWGGTSLWTLGCEKGAGIAAALRRMITDHDGAMIRVDPLGEYAGGREISMDGVLGALLGIARRVQDCDEGEYWHDAMARMIAFQNANSGRLHPDSDAVLPRAFQAVRDMIGWNVGALDEAPSDAELRDLENAVSAWAAAVLVAHKTKTGSDACFRVNLGLTSLLALETVGRMTSDKGRDEFCAPTKTMDIPTVDHFCGRQSIVGYLDKYEPDVWEYRHQRCGSGWESPDGDGNKSPEVDRLVALVMAHSWRALQ